ncbi:MAG: signal recognition particle-docking protein FtsY [Candidatus Marinimicrobia bacterium]|jgi:fused signal recognition particle receptor|nr:signal recognition particle-docking protein FtsY [Candidatus Neomarinimicrobiota bacterium]HJM46380.1 signal recognition particle-docking protein FtsY [Candidatus Neomarinimicrobiota bacterium]|tara:strand:+ start:8479 stop:9360 length:882 start_codon:yes stop_codon:yes gene_type:complete
MKMTKLFGALSRTRSTVKSALNKVLSKGVKEDTIEELEAQLITADMGVHTVEEIMDLFRREKQDSFLLSLKNYLLSVLSYSDDFIKNNDLPTVILVVGVNGTGKTTTSAKLAHYFIQAGYDPMLIAADTYRAAAIEQLKLWSNRLNLRLIANEKTKDPSAILFDGLVSAQASNTEIVIVDTAGRFHTHTDLMDELSKMERVINTKFPSYTLRSLLTIDATIGQNSLQQAKEFQKYLHIDGAVLTKMDGTAKGGIVFPLYQQTKIPVFFMGVGEDIDSLCPFNSDDYISSLIDD